MRKQFLSSIYLNLLSQKMCNKNTAFHIIKIINVDKCFQEEKYKKNSPLPFLSNTITCCHGNSKYIHLHLFKVKYVTN